MKPTLDLRLGQHLTITPQLQQAIRLLQLSSVELQQEIQEALESNPLLEEDEVTASSEERSGDITDNDPSAQNSEESSEMAPTDVVMDSAAGSDNDLPAEDMDWSQTYETATSSGNQSNDDDNDLETRNSLPETLTDHLEWQIQMTPFSDRDREIAYTIVDSINEDGYLGGSLEDIQQIVNKDNNIDNKVDIDEIKAVLHHIQNFDPPGVGARTLAECLLIQLKLMAPETPCIELAKKLATPENLKALGNRDFNYLRRHLKASLEDLQEAIRLIKLLNPRPGASINAPQAAYIVPDIIIRKRKGLWRVELNSEVAPRLRVNRMYEKIARENKAGADKKYIQEQLQQAKWFIKSLNSRNETLLKVARTIVDRQRAFFDHGPEAMKPLVLHDIAESVEMHESTISRVTTNKYMLTPRGILELKYFFSSHVQTVDGGTCSATAIRSLIKKLVDDEPTSKPISDSKIAQILEDQGITVARRTIAKYRESMNIPPSNQRKSLM
ncbi:MAG: RNA polymerase factor sigma-54 [Gammaproteobacteria bacterium]|nr:RNA polymerase factor sigma-54 [Gammaproteobacteria bacterium]